MALVKSVPSLVWNARLEILSRTVLQTTPWYTFPFVPPSDSADSQHKTSMFVPDPVISLSLKPVGLETPNFSRALNRFQREDPTFKVHIDAESKEVSQSVPLYLPSPLLRELLRLSSPVWESCISKCTSNV